MEGLVLTRGKAAQMLKKFMIFLFHSNMVLLFSREGGSCTDYCPKHKGCNVSLLPKPVVTSLVLQAVIYMTHLPSNKVIILYSK